MRPAIEQHAPGEWAITDEDTGELESTQPSYSAALKRWRELSGLPTTTEEEIAT